MIDCATEYAKRKTSCVVLSLAILLGGCVRVPRSFSRTHAPTFRIQTDPSRIQTKTNLNTASAVDLEKLPGIGSVLSGRIVAHRERYGDFHRVEHLLMVRGISDRKFREIRAWLTVN